MRRPAKAEEIFDRAVNQPIFHFGPGDKQQGEGALEAAGRSAGN